MLGDAALDSLSARLAQFKLTNRANQHELQVWILHIVRFLRQHADIKLDVTQRARATAGGLQSSEECYNTRAGKE